MFVYNNGHRYGQTMGIVVVKQWALLWANNGHRLHIAMGIFQFYRKTRSTRDMSCASG